MSTGDDDPTTHGGGGILDRCGHRDAGDKVNWYGADHRRFKRLARLPAGSTNLLAFLRARDVPLNDAYDWARMDQERYWPAVVRTDIIKFIQDAEAVPHEFKIRFKCDQSSGASETVQILEPRAPRRIILMAKWPNQQDDECEKFDRDAAQDE